MSLREDEVTINVKVGIAVALDLYLDGLMSKWIRRFILSPDKRHPKETDVRALTAGI